MSDHPAAGAATQIRVVVADDQTVIRESVAIMLGLQPDLLVVAAAADGREAVDQAIAGHADVVLMDLNMPVLDGAGATAELQRRAPQINVLVLTTFGDEVSIMRALDAGALGYLTKDAGRDEIARAIRAVAAGQAVLDPQVQRRLVQAAMHGSGRPDATASVPSEQANGPRPASAPIASSPVDGARAGAALAGLTPRELEVLRLIADGLSNREIARRLVVSDGTVKTHINNLFAKTGVADRAAAVTLAFRNGLGSAG